MGAGESMARLSLPRSCGRRRPTRTLKEETTTLSSTGAGTASSKDFYRKYGYWFDGENQETNPGMAFHVGPQRTWSTLGVFTVDGMIDWSTTEIKHVDGQRGMDTMGFMMDVARVVLPYVQPYPAARSIVVADNVALHHAWGGMLRHMIESRGGRLVYLPT